MSADEQVQWEHRTCILARCSRNSNGQCRDGEARLCFISVVGSTVWCYHASVLNSRGSWAAEIAAQLAASADLLRQTAGSTDVLAAAAAAMADALNAGHKLLLCGNGGSAADAQHMATELVARYKIDRRALPAIALGTDVTYLTAMSNDIGFDAVFARQVEAFGQPGDVLWAFSTSGSSPNVLNAVATARRQGLTTVGFTGANGRQLREVVDYCLLVPSADTPRIQEVHTAAAHAVCDLLEQACSSPSAEGEAR